MQKGCWEYWRTVVRSNISNESSQSLADPISWVNRRWAQRATVDFVNFEVRDDPVGCSSAFEKKRDGLQCADINFKYMLHSRHFTENSWIEHLAAFCLSEPLQVVN